MRKKLYIPLTNATEIHRRHNKDIKPPGLLKAENIIISSSDEALSLRPNWKRDNTNILAFVKDWNVTKIQHIDFVNAICQTRDSGDMIYFTRTGPTWSSGGSNGFLAATYAEGTADGVEGQSTVDGTTTEWLQYVWPGCWFKFDADSEIYLVTSVGGQLALNFAGQLVDSYTGADYTIYRTYHPERADWPLNIQNWGNELLCQAVIPRAPVEENYFAGPFYSGVNNAEAGNAYIDITPSFITTLQTKSRTQYQQDWYTDKWSTLPIIRIAEDGGTPNTTVIIGDKISYSQTFSDGVCINPLGYPTRLRQDAYIASSTDVSNKGSWVYKYASGITGSYLSEVIWDSVNSRFIVCGRSSGTTPYLATYSHTGGLTPITHGIAITSGLLGLAFDGTTYILVAGTDPITIYSCTASTLDSWTLQETTGDSSGGYFPQNTTAYYEPVNDKFYVVLDTSIYSCDASDVTTWTQEDDLIDLGWKVASDSSGNVACVNLGGVVAYSDGGGTWAFSFSDPARFKDGASGIASDGTTFVVGRFGTRTDDKPDLTNPLVASSTDLTTWTDRAEYQGDAGVTDIFYSSDTNYYIGTVLRRSDSEEALSNIDDAYREAHLLYATALTATTNFANFEPISDIYRSSSFSVIDGYVVMVGMLEFDTAWNYYPRNVRWTSPGTYSDFTSFGAGSGTFPGNGILLDCRTVNHRLVIFESNQISVLSPTGYITEPFAYEVIADRLYTISNPVVVDKLLYFVANNGLLYRSDGITVNPLGNAFDISKFDDFSEPGPIWLDYSGALKSLVIFSRSSPYPYPTYLVSLESGAVSRVTLPVFAVDQTDDSDPAQELPDAVPKSVFAVNGATDNRIMVGYGITGPASDPEDDRCHQLYLDVLTGSDGLDDVNATDDTVYWQATMETGEFRLTAEGMKVHVHEIIIHSYCIPGYTNPDVAVLVKSTEEDSWRYPCQPGGTITVTDTSCTGVGTAWATDSSFTGGKVADGDNVEDTFTLPWNADIARVYLKEGATYTEQTAYTTSGKDVVFTTPPTAAQDVYAFSENEPAAVYPVGDYVYTDTVGYHRITAANTLTDVALDRYLATGSETGYFLRAKQLPEGVGETILGVDEELDGVQIRVVVIPRDGGPAEPRITGITIVYTPAGPEMRGD